MTQRRRKVDLGKMAEYMVIAAWTGRDHGTHQIDLDRCAWYKRQPTEGEDAD